MIGLNTPPNPQNKIGEQALSRTFQWSNDAPIPLRCTLHNKQMIRVSMATRYKCKYARETVIMFDYVDKKLVKASI